MKILLMLLVTFSLVGCNTLKPIEMCSLKFAETRIIDDSICVCKVRDMLKGDTIGDVYRMPVDHCNRQISFHPTESWPELDAFLLTVGKKIRNR